MSKESVLRALTSAVTESDCSKTALPTLPTLPASKDGFSGGNESHNSNDTNVTEWPTLEDRPCWRCYPEWVKDLNGDARKSGVWYHSVEGEGDNQILIDTWLCTYLSVEAITSDGTGAEFGRLLVIKDPYGQLKEWAMPMRMLSGSFEEGRGELLNMGVEYCQRNRNRLMDYLFSEHPKRRVLAVNQTGWKETEKGRVFVMPDCLFGDVDVVFQSEQAALGDYANNGSFDGWQNEIGKRCRENPILQFAVCASLAGPLLHLLHKTNGGVHFVGDSSCGKTTALNVACSVWGQPDQFMKTWRATGNGLEGIAALRNDTILVLDEIGEADPKEVGGIVYSLGNGTGKQRANVKGNARKVNKWRLFLLSSGERTLNAIMGEAGKRSTAGQQVRLLDIPVTGTHGAFDELHDAKDGRELSDYLKTSCNRHYGHVGKAFIRDLLGEKSDLGEGLEAVKPYFEAETSNQEGRGADRFAVVALAGELAIKYGLLPWEEGDAIEAALSLFDAWRELRGTGNAEDTQIKEMILDYLDKYGDSRFTNLNPKANSFDTSPDNRLSGAERAGYWEETGGERQYRFLVAGLKEATKSHDMRRVKQALVSAGWWSKDTADQVKTTDGNKRLYQPLKIRGGK
ncbi:DUF927 domain-containing protein [Alkalimarinus alittae]|uniref:DUF927 domain-containing protein n=1 Tax=Alkalimarinus alittae TaxID=2961619 RepID=A0ABY6N4B9_9ALTE|nr:DUF927 domain-containing protein [Alkalimarinus alittae]UZE96948.1 DUF927 domain-containing protein [Alkalimarinus alittae]